MVRIVSFLPPSAGTTVERPTGLRPVGAHGYDGRVSLPALSPRERTEQIERQTLSPARAVRGRHQGPRARGAAGPAAHRLPARPRPHRARQGVPPPEAQDPGLPGARGRPLPGAAHPHARGLADRAHRRPRAPAQRGPHGGHRARARPRPHAVRASRRAGADAVPRAAVPPLRAEPADRGAPRERRRRAQPHVGGARRHRAPPLVDAAALHARGAGRAVRRPHRVPEPRRRRRRARGGAGGGRAARRAARPCWAARTRSASTRWSPTW